MGRTILHRKLEDTPPPVPLVSGVGVVKKDLKDPLENIFFNVTGGEQGFSEYFLPDEVVDDGDVAPTSYPQDQPYLED